MLDRDTLKTIGRLLRLENEARPKGGIPNRLWRLLLAIERAGRSP